MQESICFIPKCQVCFPMQHVLTLIWGLFPYAVCINPDMRSVQWNQAGCMTDFSYSHPHHSDNHPPCALISSTTVSSSQHTRLSYDFLFLDVIIMSWHQVQHTPSVAYTMYIMRTKQVVFTPFSWCQVDTWISIQLRVCLPTQLLGISQIAISAESLSHLVTVLCLEVN
jgi:hypothetical protein